MSVRELLERDRELTLLDEALHAAQAGTGSVVLVHGEAGIGKTSIVRGFVRRLPDRVRLLAGACDDLVTPRTLGPLRDAVRGSGPLAAALAAGDRDALLADLDGGRPTVLVLEDVQWADDATLDVLRYLGRRVVDLSVVLVVTYRDDEVGPSLQRVLGGLGGGSVRRVAPARLSRAAVARLAGGTAATSAPLFRLTHGNPFFVSELVAADPHGAMPPTVVDVVLARVQRLRPIERAALEQLSVEPSGVELPLARALVEDVEVLAEPERLALLEVHPGAVAFRHELARRRSRAHSPPGCRCSTTPGCSPRCSTSPIPTSRGWCTTPWPPARWPRTASAPSNTCPASPRRGGQWRPVTWAPDALPGVGAGDDD
jgi:hypothetical protein